MLAFTLSKINLLILVTAIFAIVSFFAIGLADISKVKEASELAFRINEKSFALVSSHNLCAGDAYSLDPELRVAGSSFYYVLRISRGEVQSGGKALNILIFSVYPREETKKQFAVSPGSTSGYVPKAIAANSFRTEADLKIYSREYDGIDYSGQFTEPRGSDESIYADPQAINPVDTLHFIKEVKGGKTTLYVVACNSALCEANLGQVAQQLGKDGFSCQKRRPVSSV